MKIELRPARAQDLPVLRRLMQLYLYDFAAIDDWSIGDDGLYGNAQVIEGFWTDPRMTSYLVHVDGVLVGFALVREGAYFAGDGTRARLASTASRAVSRAAAAAAAPRSPAGAAPAGARLPDRAWPDASRW